MQMEKRLINRTKELLQIIPKYIHVYSFDCCIIKYKWEKVQSLSGKIELQLSSLSYPNAWNRLRRNMFANSFGTLKQDFEVIE